MVIRCKVKWNGLQTDSILLRDFEIVEESPVFEITYYNNYLYINIENMKHMKVECV